MKKRKEEYRDENSSLTGLGTFLAIAVIVVLVAMLMAGHKSEEYYMHRKAHAKILNELNKRVQTEVLRASKNSGLEVGTWLAPSNYSPDKIREQISKFDFSGSFTEMKFALARADMVAYAAKQSGGSILTVYSVIEEQQQRTNSDDHGTGNILAAYDSAIKRIYLESTHAGVQEILDKLPVTVDPAEQIAATTP